MFVFDKNDKLLNKKKKEKMRHFVVVLLGLLCMASANDFELLQEMAEYEFGRTVIETIQIELQ